VHQQPKTIYNHGVRFLLLSAIGLLAAAAGACGDGGDDDAVADRTSTATSTATATTPAERTPSATPTTPSSAPSPTPPSTPPPANGGGADPDAEAAGDAARRELARWLGPAGNLDAITIDAVEPVTWSDGCFELRRVGQACTTALVEGYRLTLSLAQATYEARIDKDASNVRWAPETTALVKFVEASTNSVVFRTDDGSTLQTQPVAGTSFGADPGKLTAGEAVSVGIARAPQSGGWLLVWLDPAGE
jgi:hypothetical protein